MVEDTIPDTLESQTATVDHLPAAPEIPAPEIPAPAEIVATAAAVAVVEAVEPEPAAEPAPEPEAVIAPPVASEEAAAEPEPQPEPEVAKSKAKAKAKEPEPIPEIPAEVAQVKKWYAVKVQSNREDTIKEAIDRRVKKEGLEEFYGQIVIPVEKYTEVKQDKNGRKVTRSKERKLYPGYLFVELEYNDRMLYLFRETPGVGDFVGSNPHKLDRAPSPMSDVEVKRILGGSGKKEEDAKDVPAVPKHMGVGDRVKVVDGIFNGQEGIIKHVLDTVGKFQVEVSIFGRPVSVDVEYYQVEQI